MLNIRTPIESRIEEIIRTSEILAVARALRSGDRPRVGQSIDYYLEPETNGLFSPATDSAKQGKPYRTVIEQWHFDAAVRMVNHWRSRPASDESKSPRRRSA